MSNLLELHITKRSDLAPLSVYTKPYHSIAIIEFERKRSLVSLPLSISSHAILINLSSYSLVIVDK